MSETYSKADLINELSKAIKISKRDTGVLLQTLTQIAYREARQGFTVPGICHLDVMHRKTRLVRNPQTGETLRIAEHDALRIRPIKRAKAAIAPTPKALIEVVSEPMPEPAGEAMPAPTVAAAATPASALAQAPVAQESTAATPATSGVLPVVKPALPTPTADDDQFISFRCKGCKQEIEALLDLVGAPSECPTCGEQLIIPYISEPGTIWYQKRITTREKAPATDSMSAAMMSRTIRIELPDDI